MCTQCVHKHAEEEKSCHCGCVLKEVKRLDHTCWQTVDSIGTQDT